MKFEGSPTAGSARPTISERTCGRRLSYIRHKPVILTTILLVGRGRRVCGQLHGARAGLCAAGTAQGCRGLRPAHVLLRPGRACSAPSPWRLIQPPGAAGRAILLGGGMGLVAHADPDRVPELLRLHGRAPGPVRLVPGHLLRHGEHDRPARHRGPAARQGHERLYLYLRRPDTLRQSLRRKPWPTGSRRRSPSPWAASSPRIVFLIVILNRRRIPAWRKEQPQEF